MTMLETLEVNELSLMNVPTARQEGRVFLLNFCLIRLIHLLSLYREVYLTYKQDLLDP